MEAKGCKVELFWGGFGTISRLFSLMMKIYIIKFQNRSESLLKKDYKIIFLQNVVQISRVEQGIGFIQKLNLTR